MPITAEKIEEFAPLQYRKPVISALDAARLSELFPTLALTPEGKLSHLIRLAYRKAERQREKRWKNEGS